MYRLLIADDEEPQRRMLARILAAWNTRGFPHETVLCANVPETRVALSSGHFDLVISDQNMGSAKGDPTGLDLLNELRAAGNKIPFILVCSFPGERVLEQVAAHGGHFLAKPMAKPDDLVRVLRRHFHF